MISVLVVDDSKFMARCLVDVLECNGFSVIGKGHDGQEGLDKYLEFRPDVTLLDITMPNMDGVECLTKIIENDPSARVVMLSAIKDEDTIARCREIGAFSYLQKPIRKDSPEDIDRLKTTLENAAGAVV